VSKPRRGYLTEREVDWLMEAARQNRWGHRDATAILVAYRHALAASELVALRWKDVELTAARLHVRCGNGAATRTHPISPKESRALTRLRREAPHSDYLFVSERGTRFRAAGYERMVACAGAKAGFGFPVRSHMLQQSCVAKLAAECQDTLMIQAYLGSAQSAARCAALRFDRLQSVWQD
jgi:integrase